MRIRQYLTLSLVSMAGFFTGCETGHEATRVVKPTAQMTGLKLEGVRPDSATLLFDVEVNNPYSVRLPLVDFTYSLTSGSNTFISAVGNLQTSVQAGSKEAVCLQAKVNYLDMVKTLKGDPGSIIIYVAEVRLSANTPTLGVVRFPSTLEGKLLLPDVWHISEPGGKPRTPDVVFVPTPQEVVDKMLELAEVKKDDLVYDLGCGDGRIVVTAAKKYGCKAFGFDIDPQRIKESLENVAKNNVGDLVTIVRKDIFTLDLSKVNVVTLYLLPSLNVRLIPQLDKLQPGSRIVSHDFDMEGVQPDKVVQITSGQNNVEHTVYLWTAPLKKIHEMEPASVGSDSSGSGSQ